MKPDRAPWRQSAEQQQAEERLEEWAGEPEPPAAGAYPEEWTMPGPETVRPAPARRAPSRQSSTQRCADGRLEEWAGEPSPSAPTEHPDIRPPREFAPADQGGTTRPAATGSRAEERLRRSKLIPILIILLVIANIIVALGRSTETRRVVGDTGGSAFWTGSGLSGGGSGLPGTPGLPGAAGSYHGYQSVLRMGSSLSPFGIPAQITDLGVLPADHVFTFAGDADVWNPDVDGWRDPEDLVEVYLDPALTVPAPDAEIRVQDQSLQVAPAADTTMNGTGVQIRTGNRWGAAAEYYVVQLADLATGEPLNPLPVQRFEVADTRARPVVTTEVDTLGVLHLSWSPVDGAVRYDVLDPGRGYWSIGQSPDRTWRSDLDDTDDADEQNVALNHLVRTSDESLAARGHLSGARKATGIAVSVMSTGGQIAVVPVDSTVLGRVPLEPAGVALGRVWTGGQPADLPGALPWQMADGSTALLPVSYDPGVTPLAGALYEVRYAAHGARTQGVSGLRLVAMSQDDAEASIEQRNAELDRERDPDGPPTPFTY